LSAIYVLSIGKSSHKKSLTTFRRRKVAIRQ